MTQLIPRTVFFMLLLLSGMGAFSQQQFYLYLQSGVSQPFYMRINSSIYSSSENGYMIVPKLQDSTYDVYIGFARNAFPEQHFSIQMNRQDQGFELRNLGEKGWGLFNLQSMAMIQNTLPLQKQETDNTGERKSDAFSQMLANVVNDSSILYTAAKPVSTQPARTPPANPEPVKQTSPDTALAVSTKPPSSPPTEQKVAVPDSAQTVRSAPARDSVAAPPSKQVAVISPPVQAQPDTATRKKDTPEKPFVTRISETTTENSYKAVFLEQYIFSTDTVDIEIPLNEGAPMVRQPIQPPVTPQKQPDTPAVTKPAPAPVSADTAVAKKQSVVVTNSDCKSFASDSDLDKLRVKLLAENAVDDKLAVARKYFKTKCFSVKQIKALTELFPSDETKYRFFDTCYPFVSDTENFSSLEDMIENDYYKNRFRAMIRK